MTDPPVPPTPLNQPDNSRAAAEEMVEKYAPLAPATVAEEAVRLLASYLGEVYDVRASAVTAGIGEGGGGPPPLTPSVTAMRNSGAAAMLSPWRERVLLGGEEGE